MASLIFLRLSCLGTPGHLGHLESKVRMMLIPVVNLAKATSHVNFTSALAPSRTFPSTTGLQNLVLSITSIFLKGSHKPSLFKRENNAIVSTQNNFLLTSTKLEIPHDSQCHSTTLQPSTKNSLSIDMPCTINVFFWHTCGHTNGYTDHHKGRSRSDPLACPTLTPWTTPLPAPLLNTVSPVKCRSSKTVYTYIHRKCCACESASPPPKYSLDELIHCRTKYRALWDAQQYSEQSHSEAHAFEKLREQEFLDTYKVSMKGELEASILAHSKLKSRVERWLQESEVSPLEQDKVVDGEIDEFEELFD